MKRTSRSAGSRVRQLHELARLHGVQLSFTDGLGARRWASAESLLAVLRSLGAPLRGYRDIPDALREHRQALFTSPMEPVVVSWNGRPTVIDLRLPADGTRSRLALRLNQEGGGELRWTVDAARLPGKKQVVVEGVRYGAWRLVLSDQLPHGYHRLTLETEGREHEALLISAPATSFEPGGNARTWGVFLPLYAARSAGSWGSGVFSDLESLTGWVDERGGSVVATLPLLASFLDEPCCPSPYSPVSRLFWNELFLDIARIPEMSACREARDLLESPEMQHELAELRRSRLVDYRRSMAAKRRVLAPLSRFFFTRTGPAREGLRAFLRAHPLLEDYARFRATLERRRSPWRSWPRPLRDGEIGKDDYDEDAYRYHLYAQWRTHEQIESVSRQARTKGLGLYLDFPLGVHPDGYDVWRHRDLFARGASGGAPPDVFFTKGQSWGFPPFHPQAVRTDRYRHLRACLRHHLRQAGILRIDHVMALHRLFWIPEGMESHQGVYVRYRPEELYAILSLESRRSRTLLVGEDLGTVPREVRPAMARHRVHRTYVLQYELAAEDRFRRPVPAAALAALNTHDMPPFRAFWNGGDVGDRIASGLLDPARGRRERRERDGLKRALAAFLRDGGWLSNRSPEPADVLLACLEYLGESAARVVIVNLEDLWGEERPQNTPATLVERPNWRRKARYDLETLTRMRRVRTALERVQRARERGRQR